MPNWYINFVNIINLDSNIANHYQLQEIHDIGGKKGIETGYDLLQPDLHLQLSVFQISKDYKEYEYLWNEAKYSDVIKYITLTKAKNHFYEETK